MNHQFSERLGVSLLVLAMTMGVVTPRRASAMEGGGTLPPQTGATEIKARQWDSLAAQPSFGPVIERIIVHPGDSRTNCVLDLDSGEFILAPPDVDDLLRNRFDKVTKSGRPVEPIIRWARSSGADLTLAMTSPDVSLILYEGLISSAGSFATSNPGEVLKMATETKHRRGAYDEPTPPMWMFQRPGPPHDDEAFVFQTREGGIGLLQIVGSTEQPRSVTIRYRMLGSTMAPSGMDPSHLAASGIRLSVDASGQVVFDKKVITFEALEGILKKRLAENKDLPVFISSDTTTQYDAMLAVLALVRGCGVTNVHFDRLLVTEAAPSVKEPSRQLKVIHLQNLNSGDLLKTLKQLKMLDESLAAAAPKANLLVLRGEESSIKEATALIEHLDTLALPPHADADFKEPIGPQAQMSDAQEKSAPNAGVLTGRFVYDGDPPIAEDLYPSFAELSVDEPQQRGPDGRYSGVEAIYRHYLRHNIRPTTMDQSFRVAKDKGVADVVIWVENDDIPWSPPPKGQSQVSVQIKDASLSPRTITVITGQHLIIENQDPVDQSVSAMFSRASNPPFNILLKSGSTDSSKMITFPVPEPFPVEVSLDRSPWSNGLLFVHSNPYVAISREDGSFHMPDLPPGAWEFRAWHQRSGYLQHWPKGRFTQTIALGDNHLGTINLKPEMFVAGVADTTAPLLGKWKVVHQEKRGEPIDRFKFEGMCWTIGKQELDILPATINRAGGATKLPLRFSYTVDDTQNPAHFNWTMSDEERSAEINAVYELNGDVLRICFPQHGIPRPTGFETRGQKWTVYEFRRLMNE